MKIKQLGFSIVFFFIVNNLIYGQVNYETTVTNNVNSSAIGKSTQANGQASFASGAFSIADCDGSTSLGFRNLSGDIYTTTIGNFLKATESHSMVIGDGYGLYYELVNDNDYSLMIGFNSNLPSFFVSKSDGADRTGRIAIGNVVNSFGQMDPQAKLHIRSDEGEEASVFIETRSWDEGIRASIGLGNAFHGITAKNSIGLQFHTQLYYTFNEGNVGINTTKPNYNLHIVGSLFTNEFTLFDEHNKPEEGFVLVSDYEGKGFWTDPIGFGLWQQNPNNENDLYYSDGSVGIGTINTFGYRLAVNGKILTDEVMVKHPDTWPDFVFQPEYKLMPLEELKTFIFQHNHLPDVPSEEDVMENGFGLSEMNSILLQKIEELTLYIIEQQKAIETQQAEILEIKSMIIQK